MRKTRECALVILLALLPLSIFAAGKESPQDGGRITLTGQVTDDFGDPLVGVSVFIEETMTGVSTDADGVFTIQVPAKTTTLVFSCVGYATQKVLIQGNRKIDVVLLSDNESLDEVVVVGYGDQNSNVDPMKGTYSMIITVPVDGGGEITIEPDTEYLPEIQVEQDGICTYDVASKTFVLRYKYTDKDGNIWHAEDKMTFRNRVRDDQGDGRVLYEWRGF